MAAIVNTQGKSRVATKRRNNGQRAAAKPTEAIASDAPTPGFYRMRLRGGAVWSAVKIWWGPNHDPVTGEELDRSPRWQAKVNGEVIDDINDVWPQCGDKPIPPAEYDHILNTLKWGREQAPDSPQANPTRRVDWLKAPLTF